VHHILINLSNKKSEETKTNKLLVVFLEEGVYRTACSNTSKKMSTQPKSISDSLAKKDSEFFVAVLK
jgi:hypothetical protein